MLFYDDHYAAVFFFLFCFAGQERYLIEIMLIKHFFGETSPPAKSSKVVKSGLMQNRKSFAGSVNVCGEQLPSAISES